MGSEQLYLANLDVIEKAIASVCRRHRIPSSDAEDFAGTVRLHLIEDDYAVLRKFQGRSSIRTYLIAVISHRHQDWRNARWGKWRPSVEARRQGPMAVHLERLIVRDGLTLDEAHETLRTNHRIVESRAQLEQMAMRFPTRAARRFVSDDGLEGLPAAGAEADTALRDQQAARVAGRTGAALETAVRGLPAQDQLLLRMRFEDDLSLADIARILALDQKPLYRRVERLLADLRATLVAGGVSAEDVSDALIESGFSGQAAAPGLEETRADVRPFDRRGTHVENVRTP